MTDQADDVMYKVPAAVDMEKVQERTNALLQQLHPDDYEQLFLAAQQFWKMRDPKAIEDREKARPFLQMYIGQGLAKLAYDQLEEVAGKESARLPDMSSEALKENLAYSMFGAAAFDWLEYAKQEQDFLKNPYSKDLDTKIATVLEQIGKLNVVTLRESVENIYIQSVMPEERDSAAWKRAQQSATYMVGVAIGNAINAGVDLGSTPLKVVSTIARGLIKNPTEQQAVLTKLGNNAQVMERANNEGRPEAGIEDLINFFRLSNFRSPKDAAVGTGQFTGDKRNAPKKPVALQKDVPLSERPGNRKGERSDRQVG